MTQFYKNFFSVNTSSDEAKHASYLFLLLASEATAIKHWLGMSLNDNPTRNLITKVGVEYARPMPLTRMKLHLKT